MSAAPEKQTLTPSAGEPPTPGPSTTTPSCTGSSSTPSTSQPHGPRPPGPALPVVSLADRLPRGRRSHDSIAEVTNQRQLTTRHIALCSHFIHAPAGLSPDRHRRVKETPCRSLRAVTPTRC